MVLDFDASLPVLCLNLVAKLGTWLGFVCDLRGRNVMMLKIN